MGFFTSLNLFTTRFFRFLFCLFVFFFPNSYMILKFLFFFGTWLMGVQSFLIHIVFIHWTLISEWFLSLFQWFASVLTLYFYGFLVFWALKILILLNGYYWDWRFLVFVLGAVKVKNEPAQGRNRRALGDIGNYGVQALDGKPNAQISRPMTRFTILSLSL